MSSSSLNSQSVKSFIEHPSQESSQFHRENQQSQNCESSTEIQLQELKQKIELSKQELIRITNHQDLFSEKVNQFNFEAKKLIENNKIEEALVFLNEAQKLLEYAASSGKNIERTMIIEVLHNQACCYQTLWELQKCSNYIEALIFNFNSELKFTDFQLKCNGESSIHMSSSKKSLSPEAMVRAQTIKMEKKIQLAKYYLLYCAINSQLKNNQGALVAAKKASQITKGVLEEILEIYEQQKQLNNKQLQKLPLFVQSMLKQIPKLGTSINTQKIDDLFCLVRHYIKVYNSKCIFNSLSSSKGMQSFKNNSKEAYQKFKNFSIGNIMQLQPVGGKDLSEGYKTYQSFENNERISYQRLIEKLIVFSICQFTMATQLRYIALNNAKGDKQLSHTLLEFKESQTYHLLSILLVAMYVPFDIIYMEHIISSYHGHYRTVLLSNGLDGTPQLNEDQISRIKESVIFTKNNPQSVTSSRGKDDTKKCSTTNHSNSSIIVSFQQQDEDSKTLSANKGSNIKSSSKKEPLKSSFIHDQEQLFQQENKLFEDYYYCKKNTQPQQNFTGEKVDNKSKLLKTIKSKSKDKKLNGKSTTKKVSVNKVQRKTKSKSKQSDCFQTKPSTIIIHEDNFQETISKIKSQITPHVVHSPIVLPQVYSKITQRSKSKNSKSKQNINKIIHPNKNVQNLKHQNQYFTKLNSPKKQNIKQKKSPFCKDKNLPNRKELQQIEIQYFNIQDPNILKKNKSPQCKKLNIRQDSRKSVSKQKKQRLSSKSLHKNLSPNGFKSGLGSQKSKLVPELSKQKKGRINHINPQGGRSTISSTIYNNRQSVSNKKSQRHTFNNNMGQLQRLKTEQSRTMKASHFDKYYI